MLGGKSVLEFVLINTIDNRWKTNNRKNNFLSTDDIAAKLKLVSDEKCDEFKWWIGNHDCFDKLTKENDAIQKFSSSEKKKKTSTFKNPYNLLLGSSKSLIEGIISSENSEAMITCFHNLILSMNEKIQNKELETSDIRNLYQSIQKNENAENIGLVADNLNFETSDKTSTVLDSVICDPIKRKNNRNNFANFKKHKSRAIRRRRNQLRKRRPENSRNKTSGPNVLPKQTDIEYTCPYCDKLDLLKVAYNVQQHIIHKHGKDKVVTLNVMETAAHERRLNSQLDKESSDVKGFEEGSDHSPEEDYESEELEAGETADGSENEDNEINHVVNKTSGLLTKQQKQNRCEISLSLEYIPSRLVSFLTRNSFVRDNILDIENNFKISVFWTEDLKWYDGKAIIKSKNNTNVSGTIDYFDGDKENIKILADSKWMIKERLDPYQIFNFSFSNEFTTFFREKAMIASNSTSSTEDENFILNGLYSVSLKDFRTILHQNWISDVIMEVFTRKLLSIAVNSARSRILFISSQLFSKYENWDIGRLDRWLHGLMLHDVDIILVPLNISSSHWCLGVFYSASYEIILLDPYDPSSISMFTSETKTMVENCFNHLSKAYFSKFGVHERWKCVNNHGLRESLNLPSQPKQNYTECGPLCCLYIWALVVGAPLPRDLQDQIVRDYSSIFKKCRELIGRIIVSVK